MSVRRLAPLVLLAAGCVRPTPEPVLLGQLAALSPPGRAEGEMAVRGVEVAVDAANAADEKTGPGRRVLVLHADAGSTLDELAGQAVRVTAVNRVPALVAGTTPEEAGRLIDAVGPSPHQPVLLTLAGSLPGPGGRRVFTLGVTPADRGAALAVFAAERQFGKVVILRDEGGTAGLAVADAFRAAYPSGAEDIAYTGKAEDAARRAADRKPGAVLLAGPAADAVPLVRILAGGPAVLVGCDGEPAVRLAAEGLPDQGEAFAASAFAPDAAPEFARAFRERYGEPPDVRAVLAHDALNLALDAGKRAKTFHPVKLREELAKTVGFAGLTGSYRVDADRAVRRPVFVVRVAAGAVTRAGRYERAWPKEPPPATGDRREN